MTNNDIDQTKFTATDKVNSEQVVYTQAEMEAVEIAETLTVFLLDNYSEYPATTILAASLIIVNSLMTAMEKKNNESSS